MSLRKFSGVVAVLLAAPVWGHEGDAHAPPTTPPVSAVAPQELAPIRVEDMRERLERAGKLKDTIVKTEVINDKKIEKKQAKTLTEAVQSEPGIDAATGCSICGMKRIQINGLRGEYTTILVDDVPIHSTVSSYYGMDALTTAGIARIEVARGAGASLLAPGALGGVINIVSQKAVADEVLFDVAGGNREYRAFSLVGNAVSDDGKRRTTVTAQHNHQGQWDADANGVNESPRLDNYSLGLRVSDDLGASDNVDLRLSLQRSDVFGGPTTQGVYGAILPAGGVSFVDGDVRKPYNGAPADTMEAIKTDRIEGTGRWTHRFSENTNSIWTLSGVKQTQDSFYERNDYANNNETLYTDLRLNSTVSDAHFLTLGLDTRKEFLRSESTTFFAAPGTVKDDFDFLSFGLYLQDTWTPVESLEIAAALRVDRLLVNWRGQTARKNEVDQVIPVPRVHARWNMGGNLTSRLSVGQGYRAPLTFFESEHGILDTGFDVLASRIERSTSAVYSLSFDNARTTATASAAWTNIRNLAYVDMNPPSGKPALVNDTGKHDVFTADGVFGFQVTKALTVGASYEHFFYARAYKALLPFAAIEDRLRLLIDVEAGPFAFNLTGTAVGARDLAPYNYGGRFNVSHGGGVFSDPKRTQAPAFVTWDTRVSWEFSKSVKLYGGVKNLFDFTQAKVENALYYEPSDAPTGNYDVIHLWGPLRGREFYMGVSAKL